MRAKLVKKVLRVMTCGMAVLAISAANVAAQKVTLTLEVHEGHAPWFEGIVQRFNNEHPDIKIKIEPFPFSGAFERMFTHFMGRTEPPLMEIHASWIHRFASLGFLENLDPRLPQLDIEDFWPDMVKHYQYKGAQYCIPLYGDVYAYTYNADMYKEAGLHTDNPPQNWGEFLDHLKKLTVPERNQYGFCLYAKGGTHEPGSLVNMYIRQNKGSVLNEDYTRCTLNEPAAIEATQFVADLLLKHKVCAPGALEYTIRDADKVFAMGTVASYNASASRIRYIYDRNPDINIYSAPMAKGKQWKGPRMYGWAIGMSARREHKDEAWEFVKFLVSPEMAREFIVGVGGHFGPRISVAKASPKLSQQPYKGYIASMEKGYGYLDPPIKEWQQIVMAEVDAVQKIYLRQGTVQQALNEVTKEINKILEKGAE